MWRSGFVSTPAHARTVVDGGLAAAEGSGDMAAHGGGERGGQRGEEDDEGEGQRQAQGPVCVVAGRHSLLGCVTDGGLFDGVRGEGVSGSSYDIIISIDDRQRDTPPLPLPYPHKTKTCCVPRQAANLLPGAGDVCAERSVQPLQSQVKARARHRGMRSSVIASSSSPAVCCVSVTMGAISAPGRPRPLLHASV